MSYENSELYYKKGTILLRMGRYPDALEAYQKALDIKVHPSYFFHMAISYQRLGCNEYAERALQQAIDAAKGSGYDKSKEIAAYYQDKLSNIRKRNRPLIWWEWWFGQKSVTRTIVGIILLCLLGVSIILPLISVSVFSVLVLLTEKLQWSFLPGWDIFKRVWVWHFIPIITLMVILYSPTMRRIGYQGLELDPTMAYREPMILEPFGEYVESSTIEVPEKKPPKKLKELTDAY